MRGQCAEWDIWEEEWAWEDMWKKHKNLWLWGSTLHNSATIRLSLMLAEGTCQHLPRSVWTPFPLNALSSLNPTRHLTLKDATRRDSPGLRARNHAYFWGGQVEWELMGISYRRVMKFVGVYKRFVNDQCCICFIDSGCIAQILLLIAFC